MRSHGLHRATVTVGVLVLAGALAQASDVVIDFENLPPNTILSTQYHGLGVDFSPSRYGDAGLPYIDTTAGAPSGAHIANIRNCSGEFCPSAVYGKFTVTRRHVGMWVKNLRTDGSSTDTTLTAFGIGGETLTSATAAVVAGGPWIFLEVAQPDAIIDAFDLRGQGFTARLGIDDLTYDLPAAPPPPDFGLTREGPLGDGVRQGASASATIAINRVNGSAGDISFAVSGLPVGVSAEVGPNPTAGATVVVTFTSSVSAPAVSGALVTITGTPASAGAGSAPRSLSLPLTVASNFAVAPATVEAPPCTTKAYPIQVFVPYTLGSPLPGLIPSTFAGTVTLSVSTSLPTGVSVAFAPSSVTLSDGLSATSSMRVSAALGSLTGDLTVGVRLTSPPYPDATGSITIHPIAGNVDSFAPLTGNEPQALRPGTDVTIRGAGFCTGSPITVQFGNSLATSPATEVSLDGREIHACVPRLATDGPLTVTTSAGSFSSSTAFTVQSFRSMNGYSFTNPALPDASFDDLVAAFGRDQTYVGFTIDPCAAMTFGLKRCPVVSFDITPNPFAWLFAKAVSNKVDAHCFGMSYTAERFIKGQDVHAAFPPGTADTTWGLLGPSAPSSTLLNHVRVRHFYQFDARVVRHYLAHAGNIWASSSTYASEVPEIRESLRSELLAGNYPLVMMRSGGRGHVVLGYDIEDVAPNDFYIDIYDPNVPFRDAERTDSAAHKQAEQDRSRIHVTADGRWTYPGLGGWGPGYFHSKGYTLVVVPFSLIPSSSPILPTTLDGLTSLAFGSAGVTQIKDTAGHSLNQEDGSLNTDPATRLETAVPYTLFDANEAAAASDAHVLTGAGPYTVTLAGREPGEYSYYAVSGAYGLSLNQAPTTPMTKDSIVLDTPHHGFAFATNDVSKPLAAD
jgi:hypothetical protein